MWALYAALRCALPGASFKCDRRAVVETFSLGRDAACEGDVELARLWGMIFTVADDIEDCSVIWMPSHTSASDVGVAVLSDGELLTTADRNSNDLADKLAKKGASLHRLPDALRKAVKHRACLATWAARAVAIATYAANHHVDHEGKIRRDAAA